MSALFETIHAFCQEKGYDHTYWVAYSGGLDSHVLLHLLAKARTVLPLTLKAIHINHGLSPRAAEWAEQCAAVCEAWAIPFEQQTIDAKSDRGESPEAIARTRRYAVFQNVLASNDILLSAHHQDDQAETLLLQLIRGAGP